MTTKTFYNLGKSVVRVRKPKYKKPAVSFIGDLKFGVSKRRIDIRNEISPREQNVLKERQTVKRSLEPHYKFTVHDN
jgi:hypothetical protein